MVCLLFLPAGLLHIFMLAVNEAAAVCTKMVFALQFTNYFISLRESMHDDSLPLNRFEQGQVLLINKPFQWTSFDVVRKIRNLTKTKKVGHAGTLDPLATGLLIVCTGKFTKRINEFMSQEKEYTGTLIVGATTPTYDLESKPENVKDFSLLNNEVIFQTTKK